MADILQNAFSNAWMNKMFEFSFNFRKSHIDNKWVLLWTMAWTGEKSLPVQILNKMYDASQPSMS